MDDDNTQARGSIAMPAARRDLEIAKQAANMLAPIVRDAMRATVRGHVDKALKDLGLDAKSTIPPAFFAHLREFVHLVEREEAVRKELRTPTATVDSYVRQADAADKLVSAYRSMVSKHG